MRVTNNMLVNNLVYNLNQNLKTLEKLQYQLATGKKFRVPSDDPIGASKSLKFNTDKSKLEQYERNVDDALSWMTDTEAALGEIVEVLKRAKELTVDAANGTKTTEDLHKIKEEIDQLKEHLVQIANTNYAGRHIFSGYKTDKPLITVDENTGNIVYNITLESTEVFEYNVGISERVKVNTLGGKVFGRQDEVYTGEVTQGEKPYLIEVFEELSNALSNNIPEDIQQALTNLDKSLEQVLAVRSEVGAKMNRLKLTEKKLGVQILNVKELLTYNEGVDVAEAFMNLNVAQNVYVSSLMTGARIIQPTLVEFLS
ncbi:flagellar hook-associated protein FlgL [Tepidimicrobium xylanilyticum]|uniref:Flagellar hook-associated protein 3 FlgL n=1 Tax=Tepidimicrobium xylanilyticum TaxID=1123352 RepID=A0A1H2QU24_9FIRM|nr:flagellar hook-associated protein FlgL [Tepidimicrobium xylanilyticum]SDW10625.1 flagellar hook-associated protein 3 FlgL [Tepidimicrobium xylanilyticum]